MAEELSGDIVIVGAGVAGSLLGWQLAAAGARVLLLDAGPRTDRSEAVRTFRAALAKTAESPYPEVAHAPRPTALDLGAYYHQEGPDRFKSTYERRVGGTTWHWLGSTPRLLPNDLRMRARYRLATDWPIGYPDLEPWYLAAEQALGVAGDSAEDLGSPRSGPYPMPALPPSYLDRQVAAAVQRLGLRVRATPQARNVQAYDDRPPCCGNASCIPICPIHAKYDATAHVAKAEAAGAQLLPDTVAHRLDVGRDGRVSAVRCKRPDGSELVARGRLVVLAAHAIETPKLLLMSRTEGLPGGVANASDQVGRNLMDHPVQLSWALAKEPLYPFRGPLATSGIEHLRDGSFRRTRAAFRVEIGNDGWTWPGGAPIELAPQLIDGGRYGQALVDALGQHAARQLRLASLVEQLPEPENRVLLSERTDALGLPRPRIQYRVGPYVRAGLDEARRVHERIFGALAATETHHRDEPEGAGHIMGTCRMGADPKTSVVNPDLRSHDHPNLFIVGSGVFPTAGTANPTLTLAALALRAVPTLSATLVALA
jgi:choline dehydrogenase-like flavoprotein